MFGGLDYRVYTPAKPRKNDMSLITVPESRTGRYRILRCIIGINLS
jgi:hypothetical protein